MSLLSTTSYSETKTIVITKIKPIEFVFDGLFGVLVSYKPKVFLISST